MGGLHANTQDHGFKDTGHSYPPGQEKLPAVRKSPTCLAEQPGAGEQVSGALAALTAPSPAQPQATHQGRCNGEDPATWGDHEPPWRPG